MFRLISTILFTAVVGIMSFNGLGISTWQFWAIFGCVFGLHIAGFIEGCFEGGK